MAILVRAHSNKPNFYDRYDVALPSNKWFKEGFFSASQLRILPIGGSLADRQAWKPISAGYRVLKAIEKKLAGEIDDLAGIEN